MTYSELLEKLGGSVVQRNTYVMAKCPGHPDRHASLSITEKEGKVLLKCHAGCSYEKIIQALGIDGVGLSGSAGSKVQYYYTDSGWRPCLRKTRNPDKSFFIERYQGEGRWTTDTDAAIPSVLYRGPDIPEATKRGLEVHIHEGEKACDAFFDRGIPATCQPFGAGPNKWKTDYAQYFRDADVWIWADRDEVGEAYATQVARCLMPVARTVRIVQSITTGEHDDGYDHIQEHDISEAVNRSDLLPTMGWDIPGANTYAPRGMDYLWQPYIPAGKITLVDATEGTGKTAMLLGLAACLSQGNLPSGGDCEPVNTLYCAYEDTPEEMVSILAGCGADQSRIFPYSDSFQLTPSKLVDLEVTIKRNNIKLLVLDALIYYLSQLVPNINDAAKLQPILSELAKLATRTGCAVIAVRHMPKGNKTDGIGSVQFRATARSQILLRPHPDTQTYKGVIVASHNKGNLLTATGKAFGYRRNAESVHWITGLEDPFIEVSDEIKLKECLQVLVQLAGENGATYRDYSHAMTQHGFPVEISRRAKQLLGMRVEDTQRGKMILFNHQG